MALSPAMNPYQRREAAFTAFHQANPHVWARFEELANGIAVKRNHYSHDTIISVIRFEGDLQTTGNPFKIANEAKAFYGRWWMHKHGARKPKFFRLKRMQGEPPYGWEQKYHQ